MNYPPVRDVAVPMQFAPGSVTLDLPVVVPPGALPGGPKPQGGSDGGDFRALPDPPPVELQPIPSSVALPAAGTQPAPVPTDPVPPAAPAQPVPAPAAATDQPAPPAPTPVDVPAPPASPAETPDEPLDINQALFGGASSTPATPAATPTTPKVIEHLRGRWQLPVSTEDEAVQVYERSLSLVADLEGQVKAAQQQIETLSKVAADPRLSLLENEGVREIINLIDEARASGSKNVLRDVASKLAPLAQDVDAYTQEQLVAMELRGLNMAETDIADSLAAMQPYEKARLAGEARRRLKSEQAKRVAELNKVKDIKAPAPQDNGKEFERQLELAQANFKVNVMPRVREKLATINGLSIDQKSVDYLASTVESYMAQDENGVSGLYKHVLADETGALRPDVLAALVAFDRRIPENARKMLQRPQVDMKSIEAKVRERVLAEFSHTTSTRTAPPAGGEPLRKGDTLTIDGPIGKLGVLTQSQVR